jgi:hypothetical protein
MLLYNIQTETEINEVELIEKTLKKISVEKIRNCIREAERYRLSKML